MSQETVFRRTNKGTSALAAVNSELSRIERQLLSVVNERVGMAIYARAFAAYGNAEIVLMRLESAGFVERVAPALNQTQTIPVLANIPLPSEAAAKGRGGGKLEWISTLISRRPAHRAGSAERDTDFELTDTAAARDGREPEQPAEDLRDVYVPMLEAVPVRAPAGESLRQTASQAEMYDNEHAGEQPSYAPDADFYAADDAARLNDALNEIALFLQRNIGEDGADLVAVIGQMQTVAELDAFLPRYEAGLMTRGIRADAHIELIDAILRPR